MAEGDGSPDRIEVSPGSTSTAERGLLHLAVEFSSRDITAGSDFSLFVLVTNPFSTPVRIGRVHVSLPSELKLAGAETAEQSRAGFRKREEAFSERMKLNRETLKRPLADLLATLEDIRKKLDASQQSAADPNSLMKRLFEVEKAVRLIEERSTESMIDVDGGIVQDINLQSNSSSTIRVKKGEIRSINIQDPWLIADDRSRVQEVELQSSLPKDADLQPGNTVVFTTVIRAKNAITISPSKFRLQFSVNYSFPANPGNTVAVHTNTISQEIAIRAPVYSVMLGSAIGAFFGSLARVLTPAAGAAATTSPTISIVLSVILGAAAVVFLARKSDAQAFVSVEDIWGGALIGFLVGYSGTSFFDQLAKITH